MKRIGNIRYWVFAFLMGVSFLSAGQEPDFYALVDRNRVGLKETFEVQFHFVNTRPGQWRPPEFKHFEVVSGPSTISSTHIVNGDVTRETILSYVLRPNSVGTWSIEKASAVINGKTYESRPIKIEVVEGSTRRKRRNDPWDPFNMFPDPVFPSWPSFPEEEQPANTEPVRLQLLADRTQVYQGQQVTVTYKLIVPSGVGVNDYSLPAGNYDGFWKQDIKIGRQKVRQERINGHVYRTLIIQQVALFPQRSGKLRIEPAEISAIVSRGFFSQQQEKIRSNGLTVDVKPLPQDRRPAAFSGAVGSFRLSSTITPDSLTTDDAITLKLTVSGTGNLYLIDAPELHLPDDFEVYDPKVSTSVRSQVPLSGSRTFEYLIIPRRAGHYRIDPIPFTCFDPDAGAYKTLNTPSIELNIAPGNNAESANGSVSGLNKEEVELLGKDIHYIKTRPGNIVNPQSPWLRSGWFALAVGLPFALFGLMLAWKKRREALLNNAATMRQRKAGREARQRLAKAGKLLHEGNSEAFYGAVKEALEGFMMDRYGLRLAELSREAIRQKLTDRQIGREPVQEYLAIIDTCEMALYAPVDGPGSRQELLRKAEQLITELNRNRA